MDYAKYCFNLDVLYFLFIYLSINYMSDNNIIYTKNYINDKRISNLENKIIDLAEKFERIDEKLDRIICFFEKDIKENCDKTQTSLSSHHRSINATRAIRHQHLHHHNQ